MILYKTSSCTLLKVAFVERVEGSNVHLIPYRGTSSSAWTPTQTASGHNRSMTSQRDDMTVKALFALTPAGKLPGYVKQQMVI